MQKPPPLMRNRHKQKAGTFPSQQSDERAAAVFQILHLISAGFHSWKPHCKWRAAVFSIQTQISASLTLRIRSKPVNPAESDMILLYFCDGSLAGGNPSQMKEALKSLEYPPPPNILYRALL